MKPSCRMYKNGSCLSINNTTWFLIEHVLSLKHNHGTKNKTAYVSWEHQPTHWSWVLEIPCCTPFPNWTRLRWPIRTTSQTLHKLGWINILRSIIHLMIDNHPQASNHIVREWLGCPITFETQSIEIPWNHSQFRWLDPYTTPLYPSFPNTQKAEISTAAAVPK